MKKISRRNFLKAAGLTVAATGLAACGSSSSSSTASGSSAGSQAAAPAEDIAATGVVKDKMTVGVTSLWATLSPFQTTQNQYGAFVRNIYDRLIVIADGEYIPQGAKSWSVADDGLTYTVEIQDNMVDSAGNKITADDIVWYINEMTSRSLKPMFNKVSAVEKVDDYTIKIVMKQDVVGNFELVLAQTYVVSQKAFEASADEFASVVVSTGPYEVVDFTPGSTLTLQKRADYWDADNDDPHLQNNVESLTYMIINEASQQQIALETGDVDAFDGINSSLVADFKDRDDFGIISAPSGNGIQLYFSGDSSRAVADDVNLRQAICYSIDIEGLINVCFDGLAAPMHDGATCTLTGYLDKWDDEAYFEYDVEKAKEYLAKSNYNGEELNLMCSNGTQMERLAQTIQGYLAAVGINLKLDILDSALMSASRFDGAQYDMILIQAGGVTITNYWGVRFDMNAYEKGDGTSRKDETLTNMIYTTWQSANFTEDNIDAIHVYVRDNAYAYGLVVADVLCVYRTDSGMLSAPSATQGNADVAAAIFS